MPGSDWRKYPPDNFPPSAAVSYGRDEYGLWYEFAVRGVVQKMRWIVPGEFLMGSPGNEPEREEYERQHSVQLTQGFWLADTACTQALWTAVMNNNPSHFKGESQPVETVSHDEVLEYCQRLNELVPELSVGLPSEAQWEYACRAGSTTAFWWGDELLPEQANFKASNPYNNSPEGEWQGKTVPVITYPPNPWGLYQMHGNVWEWCLDGLRNYSDDAEVDPVGPLAGDDPVGPLAGDDPVGPLAGDDPVGPLAGDDRVLRGGSWVNHGRWLRSAYRLANTPGTRNSHIGFRLAQSAPKESKQ
ncbi:hypothetical protein AB833_15830 [Chromatiales bacterium (ex Bugula neritina AB1)]|nr:hypothetical protein AB833_15830 [Chromatiales bacterium (ex Bugula neritina AB1)]